MKSTFNVKNDCVKTSIQTIQKKTFNVQTAVHKHCWISTVAVRFFWKQSHENLFFQMKNTFNDFIKTFHTNQFISLHQIFRSQVNEINRSNATNWHFDWIINSLFCSQSVNLQFQQISDVSSASTNNFVSSIFDNRQNCQCIWRFQHWMQSSTFYREKRCDGATSAYFQIFGKRMTLNPIRSQDLSGDIFLSKLKHWKLK